MTRRALAVAAVVAVGLLAGHQGLLAQDRPGEPRPSGVSSIPLDLAPPGARALGMGAAFIGVADDATAAEANPAGLTILTQPEVSIHGRSADQSIQAADFNAIELDLVYGGIAGVTLQGDATPLIDDSDTSVSFASYVHPFERWVVSIHYQRTASFSGDSQFGVSDMRPVQDVYTGGYPGMDPLAPVQDFWTTSIAGDVELENLGLSTGFRLGDMVAIGLSARWTRLDMALAQQSQVDYFGDFELFTGNRNHTDRALATQVLASDDEDVTFNAGILVNPTGRFSVGAVYKEGGSFDATSSLDAYRCVDLPAFGLTCDIATRSGTGFVAFEGFPAAFATEVEMPDTIGIGFAWRPTDQFLVAVDGVEIGYSTLQTGSPAGVPGAEEVDDEVQLHVGAEYTILAKGGQMPISLRLGGFTDPDHDGIASVDSDEEVLTAGVGVAFSNNFQLDVAGSFGDRNDAVLVSSVIRF